MFIRKFADWTGPLNEGSELRHRSSFGAGETCLFLGVSVQDWRHRGRSSGKGSQIGDVGEANVSERLEIREGAHVSEGE